MIPSQGRPPMGSLGSLWALGGAHGPWGTQGSKTSHGFSGVPLPWDLLGSLGATPMGQGFPTIPLT